MNQILTRLVFCVACATPALAQAQAADHSTHHGAVHAAPTAAAAAEMTAGEVRKIDKNAAKVTLKHGEIKNLDMPPMTMVFNVRDKAVLDQFKPGDKVMFRVVDDAGKYTVTDIQPVP
ncbi:MAG TPA: copper-binding protein [Rubrivivax sp.]|nr:copper-binding protein [Rubrivivax sp.]